MSLKKSIPLLTIVSTLLLIILMPVGVVGLQVDDKFVAWDEAYAQTPIDAVHPTGLESCENPLSRVWKLGSIGLMVLFALIGAIAVSVPRLLYLRPVVLLLTLTVVGFFLGGCPCPVKGVQSPFAWLGGSTEIHWLPLGGFLIILFSTYTMGPTFCGWGCPLGALQEFLFLKRNVTPPSAQVCQAMLWIRRASALLLFFWLIITGTIFWDDVDPFKAIFTFQVFNVTTWILVGVLLLSGVYLFRPFCRLFCPVGLLNGLVARLPSASGPQVQSACTTCLRCTNVCKTGALADPRHINRELCIGCGACIPYCGKNALRWGKRSVAAKNLRRRQPQKYPKADGTDRAGC